MFEQILTSILALLSMHKTPEPTTSNITAATTSSISTRPTTTFHLLSSVVGTYTFSKRVKLFSKTGFHLVMMPGGKIKGSTSTTAVNTYGKIKCQLGVFYFRLSALLTVPQCIVMRFLDKKTVLVNSMQDHNPFPMDESSH